MCSMKYKRMHQVLNDIRDRSRGGIKSGMRHRYTSNDPLLQLTGCRLLTSGDSLISSFE